jgi:hypothetical protein
MKKVMGIGGRAKDPVALGCWYQDCNFLSPRKEYGK